MRIIETDTYLCVLVQISFPGKNVFPPFLLMISSFLAHHPLGSCSEVTPLREKFIPSPIVYCIVCFISSQHLPLCNYLMYLLSWVLSVFPLLALSFTKAGICAFYSYTPIVLAETWYMVGSQMATKYLVNYFYPLFHQLVTQNILNKSLFFVLFRSFSLRKVHI